MGAAASATQPASAAAPPAHSPAEYAAAARAVDETVHQLGCYANTERVVNDTVELLLATNSPLEVMPRVSPLVHANGCMSMLLVLTGKCKFVYNGMQCHVPVHIYLGEPYPSAPPRVFVQAVKGTLFKQPHRNVDADGLCYLPGLSSWNVGSSLTALGFELAACFAADCPLLAVSRATSGEGGAGADAASLVPGIVAKLGCYPNAAHVVHDASQLCAACPSLLPRVGSLTHQSGAKSSLMVLSGALTEDATGEGEVDGDGNGHVHASLLVADIFLGEPFPAAPPRVFLHAPPGLGGVANRVPNHPHLGPDDMV